MDAQRWQRLQDLLLEALDLPLEARAAFLDRACADDPALREEARSLLAEEPALHSLLDEAPAGRLAHAPSLAASPLPRRIGPYRVLEELGHGGMGIVYLAERDDVSKQVALKLVRGGLTSAGQRQRFLFERRVLARLEHPHIARLLDAGVTDPSPSDPEGLPYFAMEYVDGAPLTDYCHARRLSVADRLRLFADVCEAVAYAHRRLVVHRDLKPSNILVTEDEEGLPHVKLLDFGIAKLLEDDDDPMLTRTGAHLMTPAYAAPEQILGAPVTTATDVYALGVLLYELLTGRRPHAADTRTGALAHAVLTAEAVRPSSAMAKAGAPVTEPFSTSAERLRRRLQGDLDVICLKALRKEPEHRYASAEAFLEDLRRHLNGLPVEARPATMGYRVKKFVRRHRVGVAGATGLAVLLLAFGLTSRYQARQTARALVESEREREKAQEVSGFLLSLLAANDPGEARGDTLTAPELLERGLARVATLDAQPVVQAQMLRVIGEVYQGWGQFAQADTLLRRALALYRQSGKAQDEVVEILLSLGWNEAGAGRYAESEAWFGEALGLARRRPGENHLLVAQALRGLGVVHRELGRIEESVRLHQESLALYRQLPNPHPDEMARLLNDLGWILVKQGQFAEGEPLVQEALERFERVHGADHPFVGTLVNNLGEMYRDWGRPAEAEPYLRRGLALRGQSLGDRHPLVAHSLENVGRTLIPLGRLEEAEALLRESLRIRRATLGARHPVVTRSLFHLGWALQQQGRYDEAEQVLREALAIARETRPARHLNPAMQMFGLGRLLITHGNPAEALPLLETSAAIHEETYGAGHFSVAEVQSERGHALARLGQFEEAEPMLRASHTTLHALRPTHFATARARQHLVALYEAWGRPQMAATYQETVPAGR